MMNLLQVCSGRTLNNTPAWSKWHPLAPKKSFQWGMNGILWLFKGKSIFTIHWTVNSRPQSSGSMTSWCHHLSATILPWLCHHSHIGMAISVPPFCHGHVTIATLVLAWPSRLHHLSMGQMITGNFPQDNSMCPLPWYPFHLQIEKLETLQKIPLSLILSRDWHCVTMHIK